jgi:hypothetical protein
MEKTRKTKQRILQVFFTGKDFLFIFKNQILEQILIQRLRFGKNQGSVLFSNCNSERFKDIDSYLTRQEKLKVFYDTKSGVKK